MQSRQARKTLVGLEIAFKRHFPMVLKKPELDIMYFIKVHCIEPVKPVPVVARQVSPGVSPD